MGGDHQEGQGKDGGFLQGWTKKYNQAGVKVIIEEAAD